MAEKQSLFDAIIVGGGPAGTASAITLAKAGKQIAVIDKATFPRDKICGDAISVDVLNQLPKLSTDLLNQFGQKAGKLPSYGLKLAAPNEKAASLPFYFRGQVHKGYLCKRYEFDNVLFQFARSFPNVTTFENARIQALRTNTHTAEVDLAPYLTIKSPVIVGADGAHSVVNRYLGKNKTDKNFTSAGLRVYYENVKDFEKGNHVELHFFNETLPGYVWVFPLENNQANVGIGILSNRVKKANLNLKSTLEKVLTTKDSLKERFRHAYPLEKPKGFGLPLGGKRREVSGDRFLLTGDAAGFIDPFTGEGIGNAIRSGRMAGAHILQSHRANDFSARFNKAYDQAFYEKMMKEFTISRKIQYLSRYPALFNFVINRLKRNEKFRDFLTEAIANPELLNAFSRPGFYLKLLKK